MPMDLDSPIHDELPCTAETKARIKALKRKRSDHLALMPNSGSPYVKWRLLMISITAETREAQKCQVIESGRAESEFRQALTKELDNLEEEKTFLMARGKILEGDLNDMITNKVPIHDAYMNELVEALQEKNRQRQEKKKSKHGKEPRLARGKFSAKLHAYLGTEDRSELTGDAALRWCNVLGCWISPSEIKCAHIVPYSWNNKDLGYMFGSLEPPLESPRNGLSLHHKIEEAFDESEITIVPASTVETNPTEWKIVLLKEENRTKGFFEDKLHQSERSKWKWNDIDGRILTFPNQNRPARRYLYMRHALAWIIAEKKGWPDYQKKVPSGVAWTNPNTKQDGYLRTSILPALARRLGDKFPKELLAADGCLFEDAKSQNEAADQVAGFEVGGMIKDYVSGKREPEDKAHESDEEMEQESM